MITEMVIRLLSQIIVFLKMNGIVTFVIFVIAIFFLYKFVKLLMRVMIIVIIGLAFPFIMNYFFDWGIPVTIESLIFYATTAVIIYLFAVFVKGILNIFGKLLGPLRARKKRKEMEEEVEEDLKKQRLQSLREKKKNKKTS